MNIEELAKQRIDDFKKQITGAVNDVLDSAYCEILPHAENDTYMNVNFRAEAAVKKLLAGDFKKTTQPNTVLVPDDNGIDIAITITSSEYDRIRDNLVSAMPSCPKDLKIKSLEEKIKLLINGKY